MLSSDCCCSRGQTLTSGARVDHHQIDELRPLVLLVGNPNDLGAVLFLDLGQPDLLDDFLDRPAAAQLLLLDGHAERCAGRGRGLLAFLLGALLVTGGRRQGRRFNLDAKPHAIESRLLRLHQQLRLAFGVQKAGLGLGDRLDADDIGPRAAVHKVAVDRLRHVDALHKAAEPLDVLAPVGDQRSLAHQIRCHQLAVDDLRALGLFAKADEDGHGGADPFNRLWTPVELLYVDTGSQVLWHRLPSLTAPLRYCAPTGDCPRGCCAPGCAPPAHVVSADASAPARPSPRPAAAHCRPGLPLAPAKSHPRRAPASACSRPYLDSFFCSCWHCLLS